MLSLGLPASPPPVNPLSLPRVVSEGAMRAAFLLILSLAASCGGHAGADPDRVLNDYSLALEGGRAAEAYALLSSESKNPYLLSSFSES